MFALTALLWGVAATCANAAIAVSVSVAPSNPNGVNGATIFPGDTVHVRITATNSDNVNPVTGAAFSITLPTENIGTLTAGLVVVNNGGGSGVVNYTCNGVGGQVSGVGTLTATAGSQSITLSGGTIPVATTPSVAASCFYDIAVTSFTSSASITQGNVTIGQNGYTANGGLQAPGTVGGVSQGITVNPYSRPSISKSFASPSVLLNAPIKMTVVIDNTQNAGPLPLNTGANTPAFGFRDDLGANDLQVAPTPNASVNCTGTGAVNPTFAPTAGTTLLVEQGGTVGAGGTCTFQVDVVPTSTAGSGQRVITNTINGTTDFGNTRGLAATGDATANLTINSGLAVATDFNLINVAAGRISTMTVTITNTSGGTLTQNAAFVDIIDSNIQGNATGLLIDTSDPLQQISTTGCGGGVVTITDANESFTLNGATFTSGTPCVITIPFVGVFLGPTDTAANFQNNIAAGQVPVAGGVVSGAASDSVNVLNLLFVDKFVVSSDPAVPNSQNVAPGGAIQYRITPGSYFSSPANMTITDHLPANWTILGTLPGGGIDIASPFAPTIQGVPGCSGLTTSYSPNSNNPAFNVPAFPVGANGDAGRCDIFFWVQTDPNAAPSNTPVANVLNPCDTQATTIAGTFCAANTTSIGIFFRSGLTVNESFSPTTLAVGADSTLTITFTNIGSSAVTNLSLNDTLPAGNTNPLQSLLIAPTPAVTNSCGGTLTATPGTSLIQLSGGTVAARDQNGTGPNYGTCVITVNVTGGSDTYTNLITGGVGGNVSGTQTLSDGTVISPTPPVGPATSTVTFTSTLAATKAFSPTAVSSGGTSRVTITLQNGGASTLNNVSLTDPLPNGGGLTMVLSPTPAASTTCGGAPAITAVAGATSTTLTGVVLPSGGICTYSFNVTVTGATGWTNTLAPGAITATGGVQNITPITATLNNTAAAGVLVSMNTNPSSINQPGVPTTLTITLSTPNGSPTLTNLGFTNFFTDTGLVGGNATGMVVASVPSASTTCTNGTVSAVPGGTSLTLSGATVLPGGVNSCTVTVQVTMTLTGSINDTIPASAIHDDQNVTNTSPAITSLSTLQNLGVIKQFNPAVIQPGEISHMTVTIFNAKETPPTGVNSITLLDVLPTSPGPMTIAASPNIINNCQPQPPSTVTAVAGGTQVSMSGTDLAAASGGVPTSCSFQVDVTASVKGAYTNTIAANAVVGNGGGASNPDPASAVLQVRSPVTILKSFSSPTTSPGVPITATITLQNLNNAIPLTNASLLDNLPAGMAVALTPNPVNNCGGSLLATASATSVQLTNGTIPSGGSCTFTFNVVSNTPGTYVNTIPAGALSTLIGVTNLLPVSAQVIVLAPPVVAKSFDPVSIPAGTTSTLTIFLDNTNATTATLTSNMVDNLPTSPGPILVDASPNIGGTCTGATVAVAGAATITYPSGSTIPPGGCTITVDVTGSIDGTYVNVIPVAQLQTDQGNNVQPAQATLVISPLGAISGKVFKDNNVNPDGVFQVGQDTPIAGVTIQLSGSASATTTTDASGNYSFTGLSAGTYTVTETAQPGGTLNGITTAGTAPVVVGPTPAGTAGTATGVATVPSAISGIVLNLVTGQVGHTAANNFAEVTPSTITGLVFLDQNDNGIQDIADTPISGVTINLTGTDNNGNPVTASTTSSAGGVYSFGTLAPGTYTVTEPTQPTGTAGGKTLAGTVGNGGTAGTPTAQAVAPSVIANIVLPPNTTTSANNFAEVPTGRQIKGRVFTDADNNGTFGGTDTALVGVTVNLSGTDFNSNPVTGTTTTGSDGRYTFSGLAAGTYIVTEPTQPAGTTNGITTAGSTGGVATLVGVTPSQITGIDLTAGNTISNDNDFAEVAAAPPATASISGKVYIDADNDGVPDAGELPIAGVTVKLTGLTSTAVPVSLTTLTLADGSYTFSSLAASDATGYKITETQPSTVSDGITKVTTLPGVQASSKPVASGGNDEITGVVTTTTALTGYNFGERAGGSIAGQVYEDGNNNGVRDSGELPIAGVIIHLTGTDASSTSVNLTTTTASDGSYSFTGLQPANSSGYTITEVQPSGYNDGKTTVASGRPGTASATKPVAANGNDTITGVTLAATQQLTGYDFGELVSGISGTVYVDANDNGVRDSGEQPIAGVTVALTGTDALGAPVNLTTTTAADGSYRFSDLRDSNASGYRITETQPAGYRDGKTTAPTGTATSSKPLAAGGSDVIQGIVLSGGLQLTGYNFGELLGSISGVVYADANDNGVRDTGEAAIAGVTVRLNGTDASGNTVGLSTTTAADGSYSFTGLQNSNASGYTITEVQPTDYADGKTTAPTGTASATKPVAAAGLDTITGVVLSAAAPLSGYNFGELRLASSLAGFVFTDTDNDGVKDAGETGIAGVTLQLTGTDANGVAVNLTTLSVSDGSYLFPNVPPSNSAGYTLIELQPSGVRDGITSAPTGTASSTKPVNVGDMDRVTALPVPVATTLVNYNFGERNIPSLKPPIVNGYVYLDRDHDRVRPRDGSVDGQAGWTVVLSQNGTTICTTTTDSTGFYQFDNLHCPGYEDSGLPTGTGFKIVFSKDGNNLPAVPTSGDNRGQVPPTGGEITNITLNPGDQVVEQNLPLDPAGVIYNTQTRQPVAGAVITISGPPGFVPSTMLVGGTDALVQTVGADGLYQFLLQNGFPSGEYRLTVTAPAGYLPAPSTSIPACVGTLNVGLIPNPALIQATDQAPAASVPSHDPNNCQGLVAGGVNSTQYYFTFNITNGGSAPILNNNIPLDPQAVSGVFVTKTTPLVSVSRGGLVPYTITATNPLTTPLIGVSVRDQLPAGFKYRAGSATANGVKVEPNLTVTGFVDWPAENFAAKEKKTYNLLLTVGAGVGDGDYVNRAWVIDTTGAQISNTASATVRITPDPTLDCPDIIGRVFDDKNANGYDDDGEVGIPGVRMATPNGLLVTSDAEGRFHVPCPAIPNPDRGSNFVMKLDTRTLPSGFRVTTENPRDVRLTRGKMVKLNFGATIHRVIRIELSDAAFNGGSTELLPAYRSQIDALPATLATKPSVVRLAYIRGADPKLTQQRLDAVRALISANWKQTKGRYALSIENEGAQ